MTGPLVRWAVAALVAAALPVPPAQAPTGAGGPRAAPQTAARADGGGVGTMALAGAAQAASLGHLVRLRGCADEPQVGLVWQPRRALARDAVVGALAGAALGAVQGGRPWRIGEVDVRLGEAGWHEHLTRDASWRVPAGVCP